MRRYGHFDACEDAVQEALVAATAQWPVQGWPENPRGVVGHGGVASPRRPAAQRRRPPPAGGGRCHPHSAPARRWRGVPRPRSPWPHRRRHPHAAVPVLPPGADAPVAGRADPAGRRRPVDRRDRPGLPRARGDHGAAHQPGEATHQGGRSQLRPAAAGRAGGAARRRAPRALPRLQRGLHGHVGGAAGAGRADGRGHPAGPRAPSAGPRRRRGGRAPGAFCC